jgi:hypothetical protein
MLQFYFFSVCALSFNTSVQFLVLSLNFFFTKFYCFQWSSFFLTKTWTTFVDCSTRTGSQILNQDKSMLQRQTLKFFSQECYCKLHQKNVRKDSSHFTSLKDWKKCQISPKKLVFFAVHSERPKLDWIPDRNVQHVRYDAAATARRVSPSQIRA